MVDSTSSVLFIHDTHWTDTSKLSGCCEVTEIVLKDVDIYAWIFIYVSSERRGADSCPSVTFGDVDRQSAVLDTHLPFPCLKLAAVTKMSGPGRLKQSHVCRGSVGCSPRSRPSRLGVCWELTAYS